MTRYEPGEGVDIMAWVPQKLKEFSERLNDGQSSIITVRTLLSWFDAHRRSWRNVETIRGALDSLNLQTIPDFELPHIDATIRLQRKSAAVPSLQPTQEQSLVTPQPDLRISAPDTGAATDIATVTTTGAQKVEPAHQLSRLKSANTPPVSVKPDATVREAITIMLLRDYSQLPVMQSEREPKGIFSWKSLGSRLALGKQCQNVRECMGAFKELGPEASLYDAIPLIVQHDCVLIRDGTRKVCGIVTPADLSTQFQGLAEPFLLVGAIELHLRAWIKSSFTKEELQAAKDSGDTEREVNDVSDLTFGEYVRLLENPSNWNKLGTQIDRNTVIEMLNKVRSIRNDVMHFDPDPLDPADLETLRSFAQFLEQLEDLGVR